MALFKTDEVGTLLRKLSWTKEGGIKGSKLVMGKHTVSSAGKRCAIAIGKENPNSVTGHCWRRSTATLLSEKGISLAEIKLVTGVQYY